MTEAKKPRLPNKFEACIPIIVLLGLMMCNYLLDWGQDPHIPVLLAACTACFVGKFCGQKFKNMLAAGIDSISQSMEALLILIFVGCLVGSF